jgi:copper chaperone CopZ
MKIIFIILMLFSSFSYANSVSEMSNNSLDSFLQDEIIDGDKLKVYKKKLSKFIEKFKGAQLAIADVNGMVCDFCARGIEKTFKKDINVKNVDVDLDSGTVMIIYPSSVDIDVEDIKQKILMNGQNVLKVKIFGI